MKTIASKLQDYHLERSAYVYVRQSTVMQVEEHQESTSRQYDLKKRARELGWSDERIVVIDCDLGQSASDTRKVRNGFEQLLTEVTLGRAGSIFCLEASRLARQDSEWHRLVEVAALTGTLLIDEQQVYDPRWPDDRLMLGLKGLLSSNEVRLMRQRLWENRLRKAKRGELRINLPVGLVFDRFQGVCLDPNEQVREVVSLLFERFRLSGSLSQVVRYFHENGLLYPKYKGGWDGPLQWGRLSCPRVRDALHNPLYAGAYAYGRVTRRVDAKPVELIHQTSVSLPQEDWAVLIKDAFPAYISWAEYESNLAQLDKNRLQSRRMGRRKDGVALLSGIVLCGRCGQRMQVAYSGKDHQHVSYICNQRQKRYAEPVCQHVSGRPVDRTVTSAVLAALTPDQVELSLAVIEEVERQQTTLRKQWELCLEGARYAAQLAQRRYEQVDPENRLVARTLERQWETTLQECDQLQAEFDRLQQQAPLVLDDTQRQLLRNLVADLPRVWHAESTSPAERKELLRLLVADVTLTRQETDIQVQIRWHTNELDTFLTPLPHRGTLPETETVIERVRTLSSDHTDAQIADVLTQEGLQTIQGKTFTAKRVSGLRRRHGIYKQPA
jgi:DNA invertase Pin-like site-specific DNA recombinase